MSGFTVAYLARLEIWGLAAALIQGFVLWGSWRVWSRVTADASASLRHRLACAHFAALILLPFATVAVVHWTASSAEPQRETAAAAAALLEAACRKVLWLAAPASALWLAGAAVMALRLASEARRLGSVRSAWAPAALNSSVRRLALGWIDATALQVRSADVGAPQVSGLWRRVLLVPRDLEARLPSKEGDAVLLHELAHVRRGDFAWNLVQRLMLAGLWFHPAAWALYRVIAREREACCDALAVRHGACARSLARGLVRLAETQAGAGLAMGIAREGDLADRVRRLLGPRSAAGPAPPRLWAAAGAAPLLCLALLGAGRLDLADPTMPGLYLASAFGPTIWIQARDPAGAFALQIRQGRVLAASVQRRRLPRSGIVQDGDRVLLVGDRREPIVALNVSPQGRVRWEPRS